MSRTIRSLTASRTLKNKSVQTVNATDNPALNVKDSLELPA